MKNSQYKKPFFIFIFLIIISTMCNAQSNTGVPFHELGISEQEYKDQLANKDTSNKQESIGFYVDKKTLHPFIPCPDKVSPLKFNPIPFIPMENCIIKEEDYENN